jgi:hypothetical protein
MAKTCEVRDMEKGRQMRMPSPHEDQILPHGCCPPVTTDEASQASSWCSSRTSAHQTNPTNLRPPGSRMDQDEIEDDDREDDRDQL